MQAQPHHAGIGSIFKMLLTLGIFAALISVFGPLLREGPSQDYEWGPQPSPVERTRESTSSGAGQEAGAQNGEPGFPMAAAPRPSGALQPQGPVEAGTSSPQGITGDGAYDCTVTGINVAQVNLAEIKAYMDRVYEDFVQAEQTGDAMLARDRHDAYITSKTDLENKKWRCLHCANEIGCSGE